MASTIFATMESALAMTPACAIPDTQDISAQREHVSYLTAAHYKSVLLLHVNLSVSVKIHLCRECL